MRVSLRYSYLYYKQPIEMYFIVIQYLQKFLLIQIFNPPQDKIAFRLAKLMLKVKQFKFEVPIKLLSQMKGKDSSDVIDAILPALNNSIIVSGKKYLNTDKHNNHKTLILVLKNSEIAWKMDIVASGKLKMPNSHQIVFYSKKDSQFVFISLIGYKVSTRKMKEGFQIKNYFVFPFTRMIVVVIEGKIQIVIKYYDFEDFKKGKNALQVVILQLRFGQELRYNPVQMNNRSKIGLILQNLETARSTLHSFSYQQYPESMKKCLQHQQYQLDPYIQQHIPNTSSIKILEISSHKYLFNAQTLFGLNILVGTHIEDRFMRVIHKQQWAQMKKQQENSSIIVGNYIIKNYLQYVQQSQKNVRPNNQQTILVKNAWSSRFEYFQMTLQTGFFETNHFYEAEWNPDTLVYFDESQLLVRINRNQQLSKLSTISSRKAYFCILYCTSTRILTMIYCKMPYN